MARKLAEVTKSEPTTADLTAQVETLREDVSNLTALLGEFTKQKGSDLTDAAKEKFTSVREETEARASAAADATSKQIAQLQGQTNEFIKSQPATAMGIAAGIGFLVGFMSGRK